MSEAPVSEANFISHTCGLYAQTIHGMATSPSRDKVPVSQEEMAVMLQGAMVARKGQHGFLSTGDLRQLCKSIDMLIVKSTAYVAEHFAERVQDIATLCAARHHIDGRPPPPMEQGIEEAWGKTFPVKSYFDEQDQTNPVSIVYKRESMAQKSM